MSVFPAEGNAGSARVVYSDCCDLCWLAFNHTMLFHGLFLNKSANRLSKGFYDFCNLQEASMLDIEDIDEFSSLYFDDVQLLRVLDPEAEHQTAELKEECKEFLEKSDDFRQLVSDVLKLSNALAEEVEQEKMKAIACQNLLHSLVKARQNKHEQLRELINEKLNELERLRLQHSSLLKVEAEQNDFMEQFLLRKST